MVEQRAYARAGLLGNPSDGYFGKTISIILRNFAAHVSLHQSPQLRIESQEIEHKEQDPDIYRGIDHLTEVVSGEGYLGGARLVKAAIKKFHDYCSENGIVLQSRNFTTHYHSSIPRQVGLAGSSAIITAMMQALMEFYEVSIPLEILPNLVLSAEVDELGITAGLQDRVIQVYEGCVYMDFSPDVMDESGHGRYERLNPALLPNLFVAYKTEPEEVSGSVHNDLRARFEERDTTVISTLERIARLAEEGREAILHGDTATLHRLMNENFDLRCTIMNISEGDREMVQRARSRGASAKFTGSGGAIIGIYEDETMFERLVDEMKPVRASVIRPQIA